MPDSADDTRGTTSSDPTGVIFLVEPDDGGGPVFECSVIEQDCPPDEKCTVFANDGGNIWNSTKCVPVVADPVGVDEPCHVLGWLGSGFDDCGLGAMCFYVDPRTLEGLCVPFCMGNESNPYCEDPNRSCYIGGDTSLPLCLLPCNPVTQDCGAGQGCYFTGGEWKCVPDASGAQGAYGDLCEYVNVCDPGLVCLGSSAVPLGRACDGAIGCCTEICDLSDPAGDLQCTGAADGQVCLAWYDDGRAPPSHEDVGVCTLPQ